MSTAEAIMSGRDEDDWNDDDEYEPRECDCSEADYDLLAGHARCYECGRSWTLSSAELKARLKLEAQFFHDYYADEDSQP